MLLDTASLKVVARINERLGLCCGMKVDPADQISRRLSEQPSQFLRVSHREDGYRRARWQRNDAVRVAEAHGEDDGTVARRERRR